MRWGVAELLMLKAVGAVPILEPPTIPEIRLPWITNRITAVMRLQLMNGDLEFVSNQL
jgi:hypothetical protein